MMKKSETHSEFSDMIMNIKTFDMNIKTISKWWYNIRSWPNFFKHVLTI